MYKLILRETGKFMTPAEAALLSDGRIVILDADGQYHFADADAYEIIRYPIPSREQFKKLLSDVETVNLKQERINDVLRENCIDGFLIFHTLDDTILKYLREAFHDESDYIYYFITDLDYGKKWKPGMILDGEKDIPLQTSDQLYDLLVENIQMS